MTAPGPAPLRQGFVDQLFKSGAGQGNAPYWYNKRPGEEGDIYNAALGSLEDPAQRRATVDYLFDTGVASGDRNYWYDQRGAEDKDLIALFDQVGLSGANAAPSGGASSTAGSSVEDLWKQQLDAAIASIGATFGGDIAQQEALLALLAPQLAQLTQQNEQGRAFAVEDAQENAVERGIFRSGITAQNVQRAADPFTNAIATATGQLGVGGSQNRQIQSAILALRSQQSAQENAARIASQRDWLEYELTLAGQR